MASNAPEGEVSYQVRGSRPASRSRLIIALTLLAFIGGLAAMAWAMERWQGGWRFGQNPQDPAMVTTTPPVPTPAPVAPAPLAANPGEARVADLEQRMTRLSIAAESASGYANRAEAIMIAFAARRALDAGMPLGYVEGQLRLLFGDAQPKAVATIVNAAAEPVTLSTLRTGLDNIRNSAVHGVPGESWWSGLVREVRGLAVIHKASAPTPDPEQRVLRARLAVESGQIDLAMDEVTALPRQPETSQWLEQARRYNEAHRALDVIEAAAILEPRAAATVMPGPAAPAPAHAAPMPAPALRR